MKGKEMRLTLYDMSWLIVLYYMLNHAVQR